MTLKKYEVTVGRYVTTLKLSEEDAKRMGLLDQPKPQTKARKPANKARTADDK